MPAIDIKDKVVLITGANRGIGRSFATVALAQGAKKVYACARNTDQLADLVAQDSDRVVPIQLDVTKQDQIDAAAAAAQDTEILINNSGMGSNLGGPVSATTDEAGMRMEMEVNYFGILKMCRAFAGIVGKNGGGCIINILSVAGLSNFPFAPGYSASKHAAHSMTQHLRAELTAQGTLVTGVYPGPVDTDMAKALPFDKVSPDSVAEHVYACIAKGDEDVYPDPFAVEFVKGLQADRKALEKANAAAITG